MPFYNREKEIKQMKALLSGEPNLVYFIYGPINSGKTSLITKVVDELSDKYIVFYLNFRGIYIRSVEDLLQVLFEVKTGQYKEEVKELFKECLREGIKVVKIAKGIPIPESLFEKLFSKKNLENVFRYLEKVFEEIRNSGKNPVFILDELQTIKELINTAGKSVIQELFNFLVRLTKETHLCHCLCVTSDCLFIEDIYSNARLEGRAKYILVDDLSKESSLKVYEEFGFENRELVWEYIGGKVGDMIRLFEEKKIGLDEKSALEELLQDEVGKLRMIEGDIFEKYEEAEAFWSYLQKFKDGWEQSANLRKEKKFMFFWVERNILFYNPTRNTVRPQGRLIQKAIKEVM